MIFDRASDTSNCQWRDIRSTDSSNNSSSVQPIQFSNPYDSNKSIENHNGLNNDYVVNQVSIGTLPVSTTMLHALQHQIDNEYITESINYIKLQYRQSMNNIVNEFNEKLQTVLIDVSNNTSDTTQHMSSQLSQHKRVSAKYNKYADVSSEQSSDSDEYIPSQHEGSKKRRNAVIHQCNSKVVLPAAVYDTEHAEKQKFNTVDVFSIDHMLTINNIFGNSIIDEVMNSDTDHNNVFNSITGGN